MRYVARCALLGLCSVATACASTRIIWRPNRAADVPDGTEVRYLDDAQRVQMSGRALGWTSDAPRIIAPLGDTVVIPRRAQLEVKVAEPERRTRAGAIVGYVAGILVTVGSCGGERYCGEQNPIPALAVLVGAIAGHYIADYWLAVAWNGP